MASRVVAALLLAFLAMPSTLAATCPSAWAQLKNYDTISGVVSTWFHSVTNSNLSSESCKHKRSRFMLAVNFQRITIYIFFPLFRLGSQHPRGSPSRGSLAPWSRAYHTHQCGHEQVGFSSQGFAVLRVLNALQLLLTRTMHYTCDSQVVGANQNPGQCP